MEDGRRRPPALGQESVWRFPVSAVARAGDRCVRVDHRDGLVAETRGVGSFKDVPGSMRS